MSEIYKDFKMYISKMDILKRPKPRFYALKRLKLTCLHIWVLT